MRQTIMITGTSSGIGRATVRYFSDRGWQVAATMRKPEAEREMSQWPNVRLYKLDVLDEDSIAAALKKAIADFGQIDVVCNNAGYGAIGIFEKATQDQIRKQFDTNVFGCMNVIRAILPHFRTRRSGTIINITSMGGRITFPIYSVYHGAKWAMEGFSESLQFELRPLGIRVKTVEPGPIKTDFYSRSQELFTNDRIKDYDAYEKTTLRNTQDAGAQAPGPEVVAKTIFKAANDTGFRMRYASDLQGQSLLMLRRLIPTSWFVRIVRMVVERGL